MKTIVEVKTIITNVNVVDVNVTTRSKIVEDQCSTRKNLGRIKVL